MKQTLRSTRSVHVIVHIYSVKKKINEPIIILIE